MTWENVRLAWGVLRGDVRYSVEQGGTVVQTVTTRLETELRDAVEWGKRAFPDNLQFTRMVRLREVVQKLEQALDGPNGKIDAEIADGFILLAAVADAAHVPIAPTIRRKMDQNRLKYKDAK